MKAGKLEITGGFLLFLAWLNYLDHQNTVPMVILACVLHELGHLLVLIASDAHIKHIRLTPAGAEIMYEGTLVYWQEALAALAGPGINLLLALLFSTKAEYWSFAGVNLALGCFNMLPIRCLDGGRALSCILSALTGLDQMNRLAQILDRISVLILFVSGIIAAIRWKNQTFLLVASWMVLNAICQKRRE